MRLLIYGKFTQRPARGGSSAALCNLCVSVQRAHAIDYTGGPPSGGCSCASSVWFHPARGACPADAAAHGVIGKFTRQRTRRSASSSNRASHRPTVPAARPPAPCNHTPLHSRCLARLAACFCMCSTPTNPFALPAVVACAAAAAVSSPATSNCHTCRRRCRHPAAAGARRHCRCCPAAAPTLATFAALPTTGTAAVVWWQVAV